MCDSPISIKNKCKHFNPYIDPAFIQVPCGHCRSCMERKKDDWFIRANAEYKRCINKGGYVLFPTLTYNDFNLPQWFDPEYNFTCPIFDKSHFVSFRNKLRVYLKRFDIDLTGDDSLRYFYCTEYGGKKGRPHIHVLLFIPKNVSLSLMKRLVKKAWIYGFVRYSPSGDCIKSSKGISYVMKYLSKDMAWLKEYGIFDYMKKLEEDCDTTDLVKKRYSEVKLKLFKRSMPHHCQSMGFGSSFEVTDDMFVNDSISASDIGLYGKKFIYHVPDYYKRKFLYDFRKDENVFVINQRGLELMAKRFPFLVSDVEKYLNSKVYSNYYESFTEFYRDINDVPFYECYKKLREIDLHDVATYMVAFRGIQVSQGLEDMSFHDVVNYINENAISVYLYRKDKRFSPLGDNYFKFYDDVFTLGSVPSWSFVECALQFMRMADSIIEKDSQFKYEYELYKSQIQVKL